MKKKKRNFIIKICSLLLFGIISVTLLGSWTYNPSTDTLTSENIFNNTTNYTNNNANGVSITINGNSCILNGTSNDGFYNGLGTIILSSGTYSFKEYILNGSFNSTLDRIKFGLYDSNFSQLALNNPEGTFTLNQDTTINIVIWFGDSGITFNNCSIGYMLNNGSTILPYEPYGTYVNQQKLDDLELDYDDLAEKYSNLYDEKEQLQQQYDSLLTNYNTLNTNYEQLQQNYNTLENNYNNLSSRYSSLTDEYDTLLEEKQELQQQLADLNNELQLLRPYIFNSSDIVVKVGNATQTGDNFVSTSVVSNVSSYFDNYGSFDLDSLYSNYSGFGSTYNAICFEVPNYNLMLYNVSFSFTGYPDMLYRLNYQDSVGNNLVVARDFTESYTDLYGFSIVSGLRNSSMWDSSQPIEYCTYSKIVFVGLNTGALNVKNLNFSSSSGYSEGFNQGYNSIKNTTDTIITRLNNQIDSLNSTIDNLHNQITDLQEQLNNSVGWRPLFFAMADTPLKVVSNVLGFELFGLNLFQAFIGIITALAIIWLIRKIWK